MTSSQRAALDALKAALNRNPSKTIAEIVSTCLPESWQTFSDKDLSKRLRYYPQRTDFQPDPELKWGGSE